MTIQTLAAVAALAILLLAVFTMGAAMLVDAVRTREWSMMLPACVAVVASMLLGLVLALEVVERAQ